MLQKIKDFISKLQENGVPVFFIKDPITKAPSVSLTLVVVSAFYVQLALLNSAAAIFKGVDTPSALYWFFGCSSLYFVRKMSGNGKNIEIAGKDEKEEK